MREVISQSGLRAHQWLILFGALLFARSLAREDDALSMLHQLAKQIST